MTSTHKIFFHWVSVIQSRPYRLDDMASVHLLENRLFSEFFCLLGISYDAELIAPAFAVLISSSQGVYTHKHTSRLGRIHVCLAG